MPKILSRQYDNDAARWAAVTARDAQADNQFFYSVKTTGVYCRPSCSARLALRANVAFHPNCLEAERAGFRPCKRCKPNAPSRTIFHSEQQPADMMSFDVRN